MKKELKLIYWVGFIIYMVLLFKLLFVDGPLSQIGHVFTKISLENMINHLKAAQWMPFKTIVYHYEHSTIKNAMNLFLQTALWFIPLGFFLPTLTKYKRLSQLIIIALTSGIVIEIIQTVLDVGHLNVDDIILCSFGTVFGYMIYKVMK